MRIFEEVRGLGYAGGYDAVRRYAKGWRRERGAVTAQAYVPLIFAPGEAYQFDWSHEILLINAMPVTVKVAHVRLCHSRMLFVRAYPRESQEMVFDAHDRAFAFFRGACTRGIYDNMKTAVDAIFIVRDRRYNRRLAQMCGHYLVEPEACTPASGWEKGQVEIHAYADRIVIRQDGVVVGEHIRSFGRNEVVYDPWHYVPVLARKPGGLRNGAPFREWVLPSAMEKVRRKLRAADDGDRQMV